MTNSKIDGTEKVILQSLLLALGKAQEEVLRVRQALGETIEKVGRAMLGEQEGDGQFVLKQEPDGSFIVYWELKPADPSPESLPAENIVRHRRRGK